MSHTIRDHSEIILQKSAIQGLKEAADTIIVNFDRATLSPEHADNLSGSFLEVSSVELRLGSVQSSEVQFWSVEKNRFEVVPQRLPMGLQEIREPACPIIEPDGTLLWILNGLDVPSGRRLEWKVRFAKFRLSWKKQKERPN